MLNPDAIKLWVMSCPFRKNGTPVLGTFGASEQTVVILTMESWKRLTEEIPALGKHPFMVGTLEPEQEGRSDG